MNSMNTHTFVGPFDKLLASVRIQPGMSWADEVEKSEKEEIKIHERKPDLYYYNNTFKQSDGRNVRRKLDINDYK